MPTSAAENPPCPQSARSPRRVFDRRAVRILALAALAASTGGCDDWKLDANGRDLELYFRPPPNATFDTWYAAPGRFELEVSRRWVIYSDCAYLGDCESSDLRIEPLARDADAMIDPALAAIEAEWVDDDGVMHVVVAPISDGAAELVISAGGIVDSWPLTFVKPTAIDVGPAVTWPAELDDALVLAATRLSAELMLTADGYSALYSAEPLTWDVASGAASLTVVADTSEDLPGYPTPTHPYVAMTTAAPGPATLTVRYPPSALTRTIALEVVPDARVAAGAVSTPDVEPAPRIQVDCPTGPTGWSLSVDLYDADGAPILGGADRFRSADPEIADRYEDTGVFVDDTAVGFHCNAPGTTELAAAIGAAELVAEIVVGP